MNFETSERTTSLGGSVAVYQRLQPGKRPSKIEVIRAVYETLRSLEGKNYGRTLNTVLLRIPSGVDCLSPEDSAALTQHGLTENEIARVNRRLSELAGPARARALEMDVVEARAKLDWVTAFAESTPLVTAQVGGLVRAAADKLIRQCDVPEEFAPPQAEGTHASLKDALSALNRACEEARSLYRRLPKGEVPDDIVLEFQKSWFAYQDLVTTLKVRKSLARPGGWSELRAQICRGQIYRKEAPVADGIQSLP